MSSGPNNQFPTNPNSYLGNVTSPAYDPSKIRQQLLDQGFTINSQGLPNPPDLSNRTPRNVPPPQLPAWIPANLPGINPNGMQMPNQGQLSQIGGGVRDLINRAIAAKNVQRTSQ